MIDGCVFRQFQVHEDERGQLFELFRVDSSNFSIPEQWNFVNSRPDSLRGVHVHLDHDDYLVVVEGKMVLGLHDARAGSSTYGKSEMMEIHADVPGAMIVPRGVLHGFYFPVQTKYFYGLTTCWTPDDVTVADTATGESAGDGAGPVVGITVTARLIRDSSRSTAMGAVRRHARQADRDRRFPPREAMWVPLRETAVWQQPARLRRCRIWGRSALKRDLARRPCQEKCLLNRIRG